MEHDNKKLQKKWTIIDFLVRFIFWTKYSSPGPIIRGLAPAPKLIRPVNPLENTTDMPTEKIGTEIH